MKVINCIKVIQDGTMFSEIEGIAHFGGLVVYTYTLVELSICIEMYESYICIDDLVDYFHVVSSDKIFISSIWCMFFFCCPLHSLQFMCISSIWLSGCRS